MNVYETLREQVDLAAVAAEFTDLRTSGNLLRGCCPHPDHEDSNPSFVIYQEGRFYCYGCQWHGDVVDLCAIVKQLAPMEAALDLAAAYGALSVRRTLSEACSGRFFEPPKNGKGRSITLTARALDALTRHKALQNEERLRLCTLWADNDLVFPSRKGTPMNAKNLTARSFKPLLTSAGLPDIRLHDLRHTCATLLLSKGVHPKLVQELLGHATISITLDTYSHVLPGMGDQTVTAMESVLP